MNSVDIQKYIKSLEDRIAQLESGNFIHIQTPNPEDEPSMEPITVTVVWGNSPVQNYKARHGSFSMQQHRNITARDNDGTPMMFGPTEVEMRFICRSDK
jgi:hypothetical protein